MDKDMKNYIEERPWGSFEILSDDPYCKVKKLIIKSGEEISYQYHLKRTENWTVVSGSGTLIIDDIKTVVKGQSSVTIKPMSKHQIINDTDGELIIIEVQTGLYFGEDDIVRLTDKYKR